MGQTSGKSHVLGHTTAPPYCIKRIGANHVLVAGGGGGAKTGVKNTIDVFLLELNDAELGLGQPLKLLKIQSFDTGPSATMNLDLRSFDSTDNEYVIAAGQDDKCSLYRLRYDVNYAVDGQLVGSLPVTSSDNNHHVAHSQPSLSAADVSRCRKLSVAMQPVKSFVTDFAPDEKHAAFQKVCRIDPSAKRAFVATGGSDGCVRLWATRTTERIKQLQAHQGDVDDLDLSPDGSLLVSVGHDGRTILWRTGDAAQLAELPLCPQLAGAAIKWRNRCVRFTNLGVMNQVFVTATVPVQRAARGQQSYLCLWAYSMQHNQCRSLVARVACNEIISALAVSSCGDFTAVGTLQGSVGVYNTHTMRPLRYFCEKHDIFVTGVEFLALDPASALSASAQQPRQPPAAGGADQKPVPPPLYSPIGQLSDAAVLSISADQSVQLHTLPAAHASHTSATASLCINLLLALLLYLLLHWLRF